ncbi:MAG: PQQ-dependent sugar dehydrogenase [Acidimicrobiia bacterium]|nr:PQQ-dependent sugar dehydrogenase [Acidimicrobiia bacterium]
MLRALLVAAATLLVAAAPPAGPDTVGLVDPATGRWHLRTADDETASFYFGNPADVPFMGDWDCDGIDTPGLYRQADGFVYLRNSNTQGIADIEFFFGNPSDVPIAGDFDGDGCDTVSIYRPVNQTFYIINRLGDGKGGLGAADFSFVFGNPGDEPFAGDFDDDGFDEVGLHRASTGLVYFRNTLTSGPADSEFIYGDPGDVILAGRWDGVGGDSVGIFRSDGFHLRYTNTAGVADERVQFGSASWVPVGGYFGDLQGIPDLTLATAALGLERPIFLDAPAGDTRLFVAEKRGTIRVIKNGSLLAQPFLSLSVSGGGEQGLLGMAFHPAFASNGRFFVSFTNGTGDSVIAEYFADPAADTANPAAVRTILTVDQPAGNHNGGMIAFGPDGYLYIGFGDGGGSNDTYGNGQNINTLLGSMVRIDVDGAAPYTVPPGNPYVGKAGLDEIWAIGLRNPWRFSFDSGTGDLYIGDVGQSAAEELDFATPGLAGLNYGWPIREGTGCRVGSSCTSAGLTPPVHQYSHADGCSVTGGYVYRGAIDSLAGTYFYSDFCSGWLRSFRMVDGMATEHRDWTTELGVPGSVASFGTDGSGELYVLTYDGRVLKLVTD